MCILTVKTTFGTLIYIALHIDNQYAYINCENNHVTLFYIHVALHIDKAFFSAKSVHIFLTSL